MPGGGQLTRAGRDGDTLQSYDLKSTTGAYIYRGRQFARCDGSTVTWITASNAISQVPAGGKSLVGWRETDPVLWNGMSLVTTAGIAIPVEIRTGDLPIFTCLFGDAGTIVSQTESGSLRVAVTGAHPFAADFGKWKLEEARMVSATSGFLLLAGDGAAVVRVQRGRADIVAIDRERDLAIGLGSDGKAYVSHFGAANSDGSMPHTDIDQLGLLGLPTSLCRIGGHCRVVDVDTKNRYVYAVRADDKGVCYVRSCYTRSDERVLLPLVQFVVPAFGGAGYVAAADASPQ